jgi:hypothetical protein
MRKATNSITIDCNVDTFWRLFFDDAYNKAFYLKELRFKELEILEKSDTRRRMRVVPTMNMPAAVEKVLGDKFGYEEIGTFDKQKSEWRWEMVPNTMKGKLLTSGVVRAEAVGDKTRRLDEVTLEAKIFGVGGLIEKSAENEVRAAWGKNQSFMHRWLQDHPS